MKVIKNNLIPILSFLVATCVSSAFTQEYPIPDQCEIPKFNENFGIYQSVSFGATLLRIKDSTDYSTEKTGVCVDLIHGYRCYDYPLCFEQKISLSSHCFGKISKENQFVSDSDHAFHSFGVTENIIFDFSSGMESGPYLGIGGGYKELSGKQKLVYFDRAVKRKIKSLGVQGILGFNFRIYPVLDAQLEYKCFRARKRAFIEHSLCVNFKAFI